MPLQIPYLPGQYPDLLYNMKVKVNPGIAHDTILACKNETFAIKRVEQGKLSIREIPCDVSGYKCLRLVMSTIEDLPNETPKDLLYPDSTSLHDVLTRLQEELKPLSKLQDGSENQALPPEGVEWIFLF